MLPPLHILLGTIDLRPIISIIGNPSIAHNPHLGSRDHLKQGWTSGISTTPLGGSTLPTTIEAQDIVHLQKWRDMEQIFCPTTRPLRLGIRTLHLFPGMAGKCQKGNNLPISSRPAHLQGCLYIVRNPCPSSLRCGGANLPARSHLCLFCSITLLAASHARRGERRFFLHHASVHFLENHQLANSQESATPLVCPELRDVSIYRHLTRVNDVFYSQNWLAAGFIPHPASFDGKPRPTESPYPDVDVASPNSLQTVIAASCSKPQISKRLITTDLEDP